MRSMIWAFIISSLAMANPSSNRYVTGQYLKNGSGIFAIPSVVTNDQLVGRNTTDTFTGKSMDGGSNTFTNIPLTTAGAGFLPVANGGSGAGTFTANQLILGNGTSAMSPLAAGSQYQVLRMGAANPAYGSIDLSQSAAVGATVLPIANGGSNNGSLAVTSGGVLYTDGSKIMNMGAGTAGQIILAGAPPTWGNNNATKQLFTTTGTTTGYIFHITSETSAATAAATYTNNGNTYTVLLTIISGNPYVYVSGASAPLASGTLTKSGGTGDATIIYDRQIPLGTYTTPTNAKLLKITMVGGGGGGGGTNSVAASAGQGTGGWAGSTVIKWITSPAATYYYNVGTGGAGGASGSNAGILGFPSTFNSGALFAGGGIGGGAGVAQTVFPFCINPSSTGLTNTAPSGGDINIQGGTPFPFCIHSATIVTVRGNGGNSTMSGWGNYNGGNNAGGAGQAYGGGGGGGWEINNSGNSVGGAGATGIVIVEEFY